MKKLAALTLALALASTTALAQTISPSAQSGTADELAPTVATPMTGGKLTVDAADGEEPTLFEITGNGADYDVANYTYSNGTWTMTAEYLGLSGDFTMVATNNDGQNTDATPLNGEMTNWLVITYQNEAGETVQQGYQYYTDWFRYMNEWTGDVVESFTDLTLPVWYPDNTANVFGPKVNGSWQTCAVVDLSSDGVQTFDMIAAGGWHIGKGTVTVNGDEVVVDYRLTEDVITTDTWDDVTVDSEHLAIFADVDSVDVKAESALAFGQPISISADLGGDTLVALYIRNQVDFPAHSPFVTRFWPGTPANAAVVEAMLVMEE